ncbi:MAG: hypothetical protein Q4D82_06510 [Neisseria sp.]|nr:hypothetical protein [Neisseria sp.]
MKLLARVVLSACLIAVFAAVSAADSEAQSADRVLNPQTCAQLADLAWDEMDERQWQDSQRCDAGEADRTWQQTYGAMADQDFAFAAVNE